MPPSTVDLLGTIPSERWVDTDELEGARLEDLLALARQGLLLCDQDEPPFPTLRERDEQLAASQWNVYAALFHGLTRWSGVEVQHPFGAEGPDELAQFVDDARAAAARLPRGKERKGPFDHSRRRLTTGRSSRSSAPPNDAELRPRAAADPA